MIMKYSLEVRDVRESYLDTEQRYADMFYRVWTARIVVVVIHWLETKWNCNVRKWIWSYSEMNIYSHVQKGNMHYIITTQVKYKSQQAHISKDVGKITIGTL